MLLSIYIKSFVFLLLNENILNLILESPQVPTVNLISTEQTVITLKIEQKGKKKTPPTREYFILLIF